MSPQGRNGLFWPVLTLNLFFMPVEFKRIDNDINGNPRYVCHFLSLTNEKDREAALSEAKRLQSFSHIPFLFDLAMIKARKIGGKRYKGKDFGGGIVFQSYNIKDLEKLVNELAAI